MRIAFIAHDLRDSLKDYATPVPYFNPGVEALMGSFATVPGLEIHLVSCTQRPVPAPAKLTENIWFHSLHVPKLGWLRTGYQGCIRATLRALKAIQPDLVHAYGTERDCALSAIFSGLPNVVSIQGNMAELARLNRARIGSYFWLTARLENFTLRRTAGVICNSRYTENLVRGRTPRTWTVYPALRPVFLQPVPAPDPGAPCVLLNVGVISARKRQLELLDVVEALHRRGLKFEFHFIGRGDDSEYARAFRKRIEPMEAAGYARYFGRVSSAELVPVHYDRAAAMVHFSSEEAFGLNVAEALARNLKFFGTNTGGIAEIASGVAGAELFEGHDWDGLTNAIARWLAEGHGRLDDASRLMRERYHPDVTARQHLEIYREVIALKR